MSINCEIAVGVSTRKVMLIKLLQPCPLVVGMSIEKYIHEHNNCMRVDNQYILATRSKYMNLFSRKKLYMTFFYNISLEKYNVCYAKLKIKFVMLIIHICKIIMGEMLTYKTNNRN